MIGKPREASSDLSGARDRALPRRIHGPLEVQRHRETWR